MEAWNVFCRLAMHGRQLDTMGGALLPLSIGDVREEAQYTTDPYCITERVLIIDDIFIKEWLKKKK